MGTTTDRDNMRDVLRDAVDLLNTPALPDTAKRVADRMFIMVMEWLAAQIKKDRAARQDAWEAGDCNCGLGHFLRLNNTGDCDRFRLALTCVHEHNNVTVMAVFAQMPADTELFFLRTLCSRQDMSATLPPSNPPTE